MIAPPARHRQRLIRRLSPGLFLLAIPLAAALPQRAAAAPGTTYSTTYLRAGPGEQYAALDEIAPHSRLEVQSCDQGWCKVRSDGAQGFIRAEMLSGPDFHAPPTAPAPDAPCFTARVNGTPQNGELVRVCNSK